LPKDNPEVTTVVNLFIFEGGLALLEPDDGILLKKFVLTDGVCSPQLPYKSGVTVSTAVVPDMGVASSISASAFFLI
jgi:hypothetical protein